MRKKQGNRFFQGISEEKTGKQVFSSLVSLGWVVWGGLKGGISEEKTRKQVFSSLVSLGWVVWGGFSGVRELAFD